MLRDGFVLVQAMIGSTRAYVSPSKSPTAWVYFILMIYEAYAILLFVLGREKNMFFLETKV